MTERQRDRETERQRDRERERDRETERQRENSFSYQKLLFLTPIGMFVTTKEMLSASLAGRNLAIKMRKLN